MHDHFDLRIPELAYLLGFLQGDGHMQKYTRNRGRISVEIQVGDLSLLEGFQAVLPVYSSIHTRIRDTNFKDGYTSAIWRLYDQDVRTCLSTLGLPYGPKSRVVEVPSEPFSEPDYFRGFLDADGSLGFTSCGFPFVSWCTTSPSMAKGLETFLFGITGKQKATNPNTRDQAYNIMVTKEDAQDVAKCLYYEGCFALERKAKAARAIQGWVRPATMKKVTWARKRWTPEEDRFVLSHPVQDSVKELNRTKRSIQVRLSRLRKRIGA
jgi:hypothetical protein